MHSTSPHNPPALSLAFADMAGELCAHATQLARGFAPIPLLQALILLSLARIVLLLADMAEAWEQGRLPQAAPRTRSYRAKANPNPASAAHPTPRPHTRIPPTTRPSITRAIPAPNQPRPAGPEHHLGPKPPTCAAPHTPRFSEPVWTAAPRHAHFVTLS